MQSLRRTVHIASHARASASRAAARRCTFSTTRTRNAAAELCPSTPNTPATRTSTSIGPGPTTLTGAALDRATLDSLLRRRLFYTPSFEAYGVVKGLFDMGPPGCALQANIIDVWRKHFVLEEDMLELDCTALTPHEVLKTSGHVDKFTDWMCRDPQSGDILRADHFVEEVLEQRLKDHESAKSASVAGRTPSESGRKRKGRDLQALRLDDAVAQEYTEVLAKIDNYNGEELGALIRKYDLKNPATGQQPSPPERFNLMFTTNIGASSSHDDLASRGYLRPETAQGQFLNFSKLLAFNQQQMPFASACVGKSFRNEISPRSGLLRVREFLMAEIEHFVDPAAGKKHPRFADVRDVELSLLTKDEQLAGSTRVATVSVGHAVDAGLLENETMGYFLARIQLFLTSIGIDATKLRFRQHMSNEMAHYAADCWDAELRTSYGWIEAVGCADRSAYDLGVHMRRTGATLVVQESLPAPVTIDEWHVDVNRKVFGPHFKKTGRLIEAALAALDQAQLATLAQRLAEDGHIAVDVAGVAGGPVSISRELVGIQRRTRVEHTRTFTPNVIEPSFGIGRILYALLEHSYWARDGETGELARGVLSLPPLVAPTKVLVVPLQAQAQFAPDVQAIAARLRKRGITCKVDAASASIGKRYSRHDELGTPLAVTVDFQTLADGSVTLRDRDSTRQVRASTDTVVRAIEQIVSGESNWAAIEAELPRYESGEQEDGAN